jgi:peroxiredoxin
MATRILALLLLLSAGAAGATEIGKPAPAFSARALAGDKNHSLAQYRGKVVFLDFWASWCGPCTTSLPMLEELRREFPADAFQILAVNVDKDPGKARAFLARFPIGYPSVSDPEGKLPETYGLSTMPSSYLIDRQGVVRYVHEGFRPKDIDEIRARIRELLGGR